MKRVWRKYGLELAEDRDPIGVTMSCLWIAEDWWKETGSSKFPFEIAPMFEGAGKRGERRRRAAEEQRSRAREARRLEHLRSARRAEEAAKERRKEAAEEERRSRWLAEIAEENRWKTEVLIAHKPPVGTRLRRVKSWPELPARSPSVFVEGIGWLNERESLAWAADDVELGEVRQRHGSWCDTEWDARRSYDPYEIAAIDDGSAVHVLGRCGRVRPPLIVPWIDDDITGRSWGGWPGGA